MQVVGFVIRFVLPGLMCFHINFYSGEAKKSSVWKIMFFGDSIQNPFAVYPGTPNLDTYKRRINVFNRQKCRTTIKIKSR